MTARHVPVSKAKARLSELLAAVERDEQVTITRRGVAVARLVSPTAEGCSAASQRQLVSETFAQLRAQRAGVTLDVPLHDAIAERRS